LGSRPHRSMVQSSIDALKLAWERPGRRSLFLFNNDTASAKNASA
jgi:hypothetical protein